MLTFKLIEVQNGFYHYEIYPEGVKKDKGTLIFNPESMEVKERIEPNSPFDCIGHFLNNVEDENGNYKKLGKVAWY
ncbi:hypothetical protein [Companilactobacillus sp. HBUAS59699]|uniref:hypothetical protein n=1 Tax=Companilactobacillus sp. HBUAS59699 TaxID=3109358 RepID=UPI002FF116A6